MFGIESLDVLIGLMTVYLTLALACTAIVESIAAWFNLRSRNLEIALREFLAGNLSNGKPFIDAFYAHPLVRALTKSADGRPSYIPPEIVAEVVQALITADKAVKSLKGAVGKLPGKIEDNRIKGLLTTLSAQADGNAAVFRKAVETHFDAVMDRASGWVKRKQQLIALVVSAVLVCAANVDTFMLATSFSSSPELRAKMVTLAERQLNNSQPASATEDGVETGAEGASNPELETAKRKTEEASRAYRQAMATLENGGLQFGWKVPPSGLEWVVKLLGLLISTFAVSLGAPFWFDLLKRFMQVRQAGVSPREKKGGTN